jgi:trans-aconitate methyltransferase
MPGYVGDVAIAYDRDLGHVLFEHYAVDIARRAAERSVRHVLEIAAGTGIATRQLRDALPKDALLSAIDISDSMMDASRAQSFFPTSRSRSKSQTRRHCLSTTKRSMRSSASSE